MNVRDIFETMDYGPAPEAAGEAHAWLDAHGRRFGLFVGGRFTKPGTTFESRNPATGEVLAEVTQATAADVDAAVKAARKAQGGWAKAGGPARARVLYALARLVQKHARLFAVLETLDNGKPIRESRDIDVPLVARHFYFHAGMAQLMETELPDREAVGVCGQIIPWNFPLLMLAWKVAPALAMGNTVVLKPAEYTSLTALLFASLAREAGCAEGGSQHRHRRRGGGRDDRGARRHRQDRLHRIDGRGSADPGGDGGVGEDGSRSSWAASRPTSCSRTRTSTRPSRGWSMRSGSIRGRCAVRGAAFWCRRGSRSGSTRSSARG